MTHGFSVSELVKCPEFEGDQESWSVRYALMKFLVVNLRESGRIK